jgi:hypothetical protein
MDTIVSLTSHGYRLGFVHQVLSDLVRICPPRGLRIALAVQEDEVGHLSQEANDLIVSRKVELLTVKKDYGPATKQVPCRLRYPDAALIVMDDDMLLRESGLDAMLRYRHDYPHAVLGFRMRTIELDGDKLKPFIGFVWSSADKYSTPLVTGRGLAAPRVVRDGFFEHVGVVSYPPGYARLSEGEWRALIAGAPHDDDVVMQVVNIRYGFETVLLPGEGGRAFLDDPSHLIRSEALYAKSGNGARTARAMEHFASDFISYVRKKDAKETT